MKRRKKRMTDQQEFEIMKLVLDKFLWLGFIVMGWGMYQSLTTVWTAGIYYMITGATLLLVFLWIIVNEYEILA